jgi:hypothetical protein
MFVDGLSKFTADIVGSNSSTKIPSIQFAAVGTRVVVFGW